MREREREREREIYKTQKENENSLIFYRKINYNSLTSPIVCS
jgi:hypothetical protein